MYFYTKEIMYRTQIFYSKCSTNIMNKLREERAIVASHQYIINIYQKNEDTSGATTDKERRVSTTTMKSITQQV